MANLEPSMVPGNRVSLLHDGGECFPAMLEDIARAEREILLEMYWFDSDAIGARFADALIARAREGIRVCVTYDAVGSWEADRRMFEEMRAAGCDVYEYNPVRFLQPSLARLNHRNHRKMLVIDGRVGMTGGVNLADQWAPVSEGGDGFRDDMMRIQGPAVASMRNIFLGTFRGGSREQARAEALGDNDPAGDCRVRILANDRRRNRRAIQSAYLSRIGAARNSIIISNSYFIPGRPIRRALRLAVERGVEVRVLLPVVSDVPAVAYATRRLYAWMLDRGIQLFEWGQSILHSKMAAIDDTWCTVGTHNLDYRSWAYNLELNVMVEDPGIARAVAGRIERDVTTSVPVDARTWSFRPLSQRLLEYFFYSFRKLL